MKDGRVDAIDGRGIDLNAPESPVVQLLDKSVVSPQDFVDPAFAKVGGQFHFIFDCGGIAVAVLVSHQNRLRQESDPLLARIPRLAFLVGPKQHPEFDKGVEVGVQHELLGMDGIVDPAETHGPEFHGVAAVRI